MSLFKRMVARVAAKVAPETTRKYMPDTMKEVDTIRARDSVDELAGKQAENLAKKVSVEKEVVESKDSALTMRFATPATEQTPELAEIRKYERMVKEAIKKVTLEGAYSNKEEYAALVKREVRNAGRTQAARGDNASGSNIFKDVVEVFSDEAPDRQSTRQVVFDKALTDVDKMAAKAFEIIPDQVKKNAANRAAEKAKDQPAKPKSPSVAVLTEQAKEQAAGALASLAAPAKQTSEAGLGEFSPLAGGMGSGERSIT